MPIINLEKCNCTNCIFFTSWKEVYDNDPLEPSDSGECSNLINENKDITIDSDFVCVGHIHIAENIILK